MFHPPIDNPSYPEKTAMRNMAAMHQMQMPPIVININIEKESKEMEEPKRMSLLEMANGD